MAHDIITIGSGLGGLLSSVLLAKEGKKVLLLEQHRSPGGYCTSFERKGFIFSIPNILTNTTDEKLNTVLDSLGFFDEIEWLEIDKFAKYIYPDFEIIMPSNDLEGCRENLNAAFPSEKPAVDKVFSDIAALQKTMSFLQKTGRSIRDSISFAAAVPKLIYLTRISFYDYLRKLIRNEKLIEVLSSLWFLSALPSKSAPAALLLMLSGDCYGKPVLFPRDGYKAVSDFLAGKFLEFGGKINYGTRVSSILIKDKKAIGVKTAAGDIYNAATVISNADTKKTFFELVGRQNLSQKFASKIDAHTPSASGISLQIGTSLDLSQFDLNYGGVFYNESWEDSNMYFNKSIADKIDFEKDNITLSLRAPSVLSDRLAPEGMHILQILVSPVSPAYRNSFGVIDGERGEEYRKIKELLSDMLIRKAEKIIPGLSKSIIVKALSTPYTFERYTGATNGAWFDGVFSIKQKLQKFSSNTPIENLYMTGTKAFGGAGLPAALMGGINTAETILRR